jgi:hypothetical protein
LVLLPLELPKIIESLKRKNVRVKILNPFIISEPPVHTNRRTNIFNYRYGDLSPVTPLGRALASLCAIFGISVVSMLVSVLAERYQRVYTRKLFLNEKYSDNLVFEDDENNDSFRSETPTRKQTESLPNTDETLIYKEISEEEKNRSENSTEKIQFVIGFISDDSKKIKQSMMIEVIKELLQTKLGKQCLITRTDVF